MKKRESFVFFIVTIVFMFLFISGCSDPFVGIHEDPPVPPKPDSAAFDYLAYMYDDQKGAELHSKTTRDSLFASAPDEINKRLDKYFENSFISDSGLSTGDPSSDQWWKKIQFDSKKMAEFLNTKTGEEYLKNKLLQSENQGSGCTNPLLSKRSFIDGLAIVGGIFVFFKFLDFMYNVLESYESPKWSFYDYPEDHFLQVLNKTNEIIYKINELANTLNNKINSLEELLTELGINMYNQGFSEAQTCLKTWNNQAITLQKVNTTDFRKYVKTILVESQDGLPYHFASAFSSAVKRTELINNSTNSSTNNIKTHFCMFFSDMVFLKNMYDFEFFYLPIVYTGTALKTYRADRAKEYLDYVSFIKDSILENYNKHTTAEEKTYLYDVYSFIVAWEIQLLAHYELVYGPIDTTKPQVEPASNYKLGFGTFGNKNADLKLGYALQKYSYILKKDNDYPIVAYQDLTDGMDLTGFCDPNNSSNFELGKYFKLVVNEKNILDSSLNLTPVYKDLSMNSYPPSSGKCYIDTINGKFILPRPIYWSKMENLANIDTNPEIHSGGNVSCVSRNLISNHPSWPDANFTTSNGTTSGKFGSAYYVKVSGEYNCQSDDRGYREEVISIFNEAKAMPKGTLSFWFKYKLTINTTSSISMSAANAKIYLLGKDKIYLDMYKERKFSTSPSAGYYSTSWSRVTVNNNTNYSMSFSENTYHLLYLIWDKDKGLENGNSVLVYIDDHKVKAYNGDFNPTVKDLITIYLEGVGNNPSAGWGPGMPVESYVVIDNIQVWNEPIISNVYVPYAWIYNSGAGREDALHLIYGYNAGYKISSTPTVGYYYLK